MIRALFIIIIIFTSLYSKEEYTVVFPKNFPPSYITQNDKPSGYAIELFQEITKDLDIKFKYIQKDSWKDVFEMIEKGEVDIVPNLGISKLRRRSMNFSSEVEYINISVYSKKRDKAVGIDSLFGSSVGVVKSNIGFKILRKEVLLDLNIHETKEKAFDSFIYGRDKYIAYAEPTILSMLKDKGLENSIVKNFDLVIIHRAIAVKKEHENLLKTFNLRIEILKKNGEFDKIYNKWHKEEVSFSLEEIFEFSLVLIVLILFIVFWLSFKKVIVTRNVLQEEVRRKTLLLKEKHDMFLFATEKALDGHWEWNLTTNKTKLSRAWYECLGYEYEEFEQSIENFYKIMHPEDAKKDKSQTKEIKAGTREIFDLEYRLMQKNGKYKWLKSLGTIYFNDKKEQIFFGYHIDITSMKELEKQRLEKENIMFHQSKMASMGEMLENIAHQWRQPLSVISTTASGIQLQNQIDEISKEDLYDELEIIMVKSKELSKTIDSFRNYFKSEEEQVLFNMAETIKNALKIISEKLKEDKIELIIDLEEININSIESEFMQVIMNILNNSQDAYGNFFEEIEKKIFINLYEENKYAVLKIKDNAGGIDKKIISKVLEPYFTTKHKSQGTGLGLYMCEEILTKHMNGTIKFQNVNYIYENKNYHGLEVLIKIPID